MGTGASSQNGVGAGGATPEGHVFGGNSTAVGGGHALSAQQLQALIQAGRYQYSGGAAGSVSENAAPRPNFRSAKVAKNPFNLKKGTLSLVDGEGAEAHRVPIRCT